MKSLKFFALALLLVMLAAPAVWAQHEEAAGDAAQMEESHDAAATAEGDHAAAAGEHAAAEGEHAAAEGEHGGAHGGAHGYAWDNLIYRLINFALFIGVLVYFAGGKVKGMFRGRKEQIATELKDMETRKNEAAARLKQVETSIANMESERKTILAEYKAQGESLKASILEQAKAQAEQLKAQAKMSADQEATQAIKQVRAELAELISAAAQKIVEEKLTKEEHEKLVDQYLTKVVFN